MFFILGILAAATVLFFILAYKHESEGFHGAGGCILVAIAFLLLVMGNIYGKERDFKNIVTARQEIINEVIGDKEDRASSREKAELIKLITETNDRIIELKLDNRGWFWALETPDIVETIEPLEMYCTCPQKE